MGTTTLSSHTSLDNTIVGTNVGTNVGSTTLGTSALGNTISVGTI